MQQIVNSEPTQFQNQLLPRLSFEILSCSIAHEMLGPEEVRNIPRNHWHETAATRPHPQQFFLPLRWLVLEAWQPLKGRRGPSSPVAGDPPRLLPSYLSDVITDWNGEIKLLRKRDRDKGKVASLCGNDWGKFKAHFFIFSRHPSLHKFLEKGFFPSYAPLKWAKTSTSSFFPPFLSTLMA